MWTDSLAAEARSFFMSRTGAEFLSELQKGRPDIHGKTIEEKAMQASVVEGYEAAQKKLTTLISYQSEPEPSPPNWVGDEQ